MVEIEKTEDGEGNEVYTMTKTLKEIKDCLAGGMLPVVDVSTEYSIPSPSVGYGYINAIIYQDAYWTVHTDGGDKDYSCVTENEYPSWTDVHPQ